MKVLIVLVEIGHAVAGCRGSKAVGVKARKLPGSSGISNGGSNFQRRLNYTDYSYIVC